MSTESTYNYPSDLNAGIPDPADPKSEGPTHIKGIKNVLKTTFPNVNGAVTATQTELNVLDGITASTAELNAVDGRTTVIGYLDGVTGAIQTQLDAKAALAGATYSGTHDFTGATTTVSTQSAADNSTKPASTAYVTTAITNAALSGGLPSPTGKGGRSLTTDGTSYAWDAYTGALTSTVAVANTETVVMSYICAANELKAGTTFLFRFSVSQSGTNAANPTWQIRVGTTTLTGNIPTTLTGSVGGVAANTWIEAFVTCVTAGASGTIKGGILASKSNVQTLVAAATSTVAVDTTAASQRIEFTALSGNAAVTYTFQTGTLQKIVV